MSYLRIALYFTFMISCARPSRLADRFNLCFFTALLRLMCGNTQRADISEEEAKTREQEDKLFSSIAAPPSINNAVMHLLGKDETEEPDAEAEAGSS